MEQKFNWSATLSAPEEYPIEVISGDIAGDGYGQSFGHFGVHSTGWGSGGRTVGSGPDTKHIPDYLGITWISFAERKIYTGEFSLPKDKILALFKKGFVDIVDSTKTITYNTFIVGLAPKGHISVWVGESSSAGNQVEVATFKAKETHIDTSQVREDDQYMFTEKYLSGTITDPQIVDPDIQQRIKQKGYSSPEEYAINYRKKYKWKPRIELPNGYRIKFWQVMKCNGEKEYTLATHNTLPEFDRAIPYMVSGMLTDGKKDYWFDVVMTEDQNYLPRMQKNGVEMQAPLDFNDNEINQIFLNQLDHNLSSDFLITINPIEEKAEVIIQQQGKDIKLKEFQFQVYHTY